MERVADDVVRQLRQVFPRVDLVDHDGEVDRVPGLRVDRLVGMTDDAEPDLAPRAAMRFQRIVATVAGGGRDDLAHQLRSAAGGHEGEDDVRDVRIILARGVRGDRVRRLPVVVLGQGHPERVAVHAGLQGLERSVPVRPACGADASAGAVV